MTEEEARLCMLLMRGLGMAIRCLPAHVAGSGAGIGPEYTLGTLFVKPCKTGNAFLVLICGDPEKADLDALAQTFAMELKYLQSRLTPKRMAKVLSEVTPCTMSRAELNRCVKAGRELGRAVDMLPSWAKEDI